MKVDVPPLAARRRRLAIPAVIAGMALIVAACGDDDDDAADTADTAATADTASDATTAAPAATEPAATEPRYRLGTRGRRLGREAGRTPGSRRRGRSSAAVRAPGSCVLRGQPGRQEDLLDAGRQLAQGMRRHGQVGRRDRRVDRHDRLHVLPERRWPGGLAARNGASPQRRLRGRRIGVRHRPQRVDAADGSCPRGGDLGGRHAPRRCVGSGRPVDRRPDQRRVQQVDGDGRVLRPARRREANRSTPS